MSDWETRFFDESLVIFPQLLLVAGKQVFWYLVGCKFGYSLHAGFDCFNKRLQRGDVVVSPCAQNTCKLIFWANEGFFQRCWLGHTFCRSIVHFSCPKSSWKKSLKSVPLSHQTSSVSFFAIILLQVLAIPSAASARLVKTQVTQKNMYHNHPWFPC